MRDDAGQPKGAGGAVEFGERWGDALIRAFREERDVGNRIVSAPGVLEDIHCHESAAGQEIVDAAEVVVPGNLGAVALDPEGPGEVRPVLGGP